MKNVSIDLMHRHGSVYFIFLSLEACCLLASLLHRLGLDSLWLGGAGLYCGHFVHIITRYMTIHYLGASEFCPSSTWHDV